MPLPFSERACTSLQHSRDEAVRLGHDAVGTEHLLLGLLREGGVSVRVLRGCGVNTQRLRREIEAAVSSEAQADPGLLDLVLTAEAEEALAAAEREVDELGLDTVGAEWVLLGVLEDEQGIATRVLGEQFDLDVATVRAEVYRLHGIELPTEPTVREPEPPYLLGRAASAEHRLSIVFDETATEAEVAEVLALLSELYRALGGDGLVILDSGIPAWDAKDTADE